MGKHLDALKPFDEFRAPWETADGSEAEIDKPKLKRYIYGLASDKAKAQDARDEAAEKVTTIEGELEEAKKEAASTNGEEAQRKITRLERDLAAAKGRVTELETEKEQNDLRSEVLAGLDPKYAKYVQGTTREELEESLKGVKEDFGLSDEPNGDPEEDEPGLRTRPRRISNPGDPDAGSGGSDAVDYDKIADELLGGGVFR